MVQNRKREAVRFPLPVKTKAPTKQNRKKDGINAHTAENTVDQKLPYVIVVVTTYFNYILSWVYFVIPTPDCMFIPHNLVLYGSVMSVVRGL